MAERLNIVQSSTEPNKRDIWLKDGKFKKFGPKGWKNVGGDSIDESTPVKTEVSGNELVQIVDNGVPKAASVDALVKGAKEVYVLSGFSSCNYDELVEAIDSNKLLYMQLGDALLPMIVSYKSGDNIQLTACQGLFNTRQDTEIVKSSFAFINMVATPNGFINISTGSFNLDKSGNGTKFLSDNGRYKEIDITSATPYVFNYTGQTSVTQEEYDELKAAILAKKRILVVDTTIDNMYINTSLCAYIEDEDAIIMQLSFCAEYNIVTLGYLIQNLDITRTNIITPSSADIVSLQDTIGTKQNKISDLETIRANAALGAAALQSVPAATNTALGGVKQVTIPQLAEDADLASVIAAYNDLVTKLVASGIAVASA